MKKFIPLIVFSIIIIVILLTMNLTFSHDCGDYLGTSKLLTGILNSKARGTHSWIYGIILSFFLRIWASHLFMNLLNVVWLVLNGLLLYHITKDKRVLWLWFLCPVVWLAIPVINPIMPVSFLFLLSYYFIKKFEQENKIKHLIYSALLFGLSAILWDSIIYFTPFFIFLFFLNKKFKDFAIFLGIFLAVFSIRLITEYYLFRFPFFSIVRSIGGALLVLTRQENYSTVSPTLLNYLSMILVISPMLFRLYRIKFKEYWREIVFCLICFMFFTVSPTPTYMLFLAPFLIIMLNKVLSKRDFIIYVFFTFITILIVIYPFYTDNTNELIKQDLKEISRDYPNESFITGNEEHKDLYLLLSMIDWESNSEYISWWDYSAWATDNPIFVKTSIESKSRVNNLRKLYIYIALVKNDNRTYENVVLAIDMKNKTDLEDFYLEKEYQVLNVFRKWEKVKIGRVPIKT